MSTTIMKKFLFIIVCVLCLNMQFTSCSFNKGLDFPIDEILTPELMPLYGLTYPYRIDIKHPFMYLQNDDKLKDSLFHIYDLKTGHLKCAFGTIGEGPNDFILPTMIPTYLPYLIVKDKDEFRLFNIDKEGQMSFMKNLIPQYTYNISQATFINDTLFAVDAMYMGPNINICSINDEMPKKQWEYRNPNLMDYYMDMNKGKVYANKDRIVFCYEMKKQIDFMDTDFNLIKRVRFDDYDEPLEVNQNPGDERNSYIYSFLGNKYLYTMFLGTTWNEDKARNTCGYHIEVFDLNGNPIARYQMNGRRPLFFAVDEKTFTLYGPGCQGNPEDHLLVYKLKELE